MIWFNNLAKNVQMATLNSLKPQLNRKVFFFFALTLRKLFLDVYVHISALVTKEW